MDLDQLLNYANHIGTFIGMSASLVALYKVRQNKRTVLKIRAAQKTNLDLAKIAAVWYNKDGPKNDNT